MGSEMDTFAARLASFDVVLKPDKRRSSGVKGPRFIGWPHSNPSPEELARAGFFYKPYESNPDNTTCFECGRALDGWEEDDNPIAEHLKHSPNCGWAITMDVYQNSSNHGAIDDPTSDRITQARLATFGSAWPHDGKRGWACQSEKMAEAGWYFCPTEDSNDLASCAYCKLSLDGWEPKDDPYEEHHRRSPGCSFFIYGQAPAKKGKGAKSKKTRVSKASSRLSTQSVDTVASEAPGMDIDDSMDQSIMSQAPAKQKATKKTAKGKGKSSKSKKEKDNVETESHMDMDDEPEQPEPEESESSKPKRAGRGRKRASEEISKYDPESVDIDEQKDLSPEPPTKRRNMRAGSNISPTYNYESNDDDMPDAAPVEEEIQEEKPKRGRKKKGTSKNRKASDISVMSKSESKARAPRDSEIDAAIHAGLDEDATEEAAPEQMDVQEPEVEPELQPAPRAKKKAGRKPKAAAKQEPEDTPADREDPVEQPEVNAEHEVEATEAVEEAIEEPGPRTKAGKVPKKRGPKKGSKRGENKAKESESRESSGSKAGPDDDAAEEQQESFLSVENANQDSRDEPEPQPEPELELETPEKPAGKKSSKKEEKAKKTKKLKKKAPSPTPEPVEEEPIEDAVIEDHVDDRQNEPLSPSVNDEGYETPDDDLPDQVEMIEPFGSSPEAQKKQRTPVPPKTTKRFSDIPQEEHLAESITRSHSSRGNNSQRTSQQSNRPVSPLPSTHQSTSSMSPQSSDAENRPPSSRPPQIVPSQELHARTPLAAATPSPSKRGFNVGFAPSSQPWTPVDVDEALFGEASDKENADIAGLLSGVKRGLTSPEKKMTVEEWIMWNAKNGEERLKRECERLVSQFEKEGARAMQRLEAIECID
ncbi:hypothetical protein N7493_001885 [Penicillium malachiteum]|uniref:Chromosome segregation protein BIR1 n=1 Tax=Penicillium malachiteum TaxID=1324776 RepID=A0AAD6HUZ6_9EURO|nr:hypothetical protein N7493_001885 [Penicillium malachiteum]